MAAHKSDLPSSEKIHANSSTSVDSEEESFVVLWKDADSNKGGDGISIESAISDMSFVEKASLNSKTLTDTDHSIQSLSEIKMTVDGPSNTKEKTVESSQVEQLMTLSKMQFDEANLDEDTSGVISITTVSTDLTSEQIQKKISDLIEENTRLKYLIVQNNATMKSQCEKIVAWQEDVQKVHEIHRKKIIEAKEFIEKLKLDKYNLTLELEQMRKDKITQDEALSEKEQKLSLSTGMDTKLMELKLENDSITADNITLNGKIEKYKKEVAALQTELFTARNDIGQAKAELIKTKSAYEDELKSLNLIINTLGSEHESALSGNSRLGSYAQIENLNKEVLQLRKQLENCQAHTHEMHALKTQLDVYKTDFDTESSAKGLLQTENNKLLEEIKKLQGNNNKLQQKLNSIRENYLVIPKQGGYKPPDEECCIQ